MIYEEGFKVIFMCGFCGYVDFKNHIQQDTIIKQMTKTLKNRGPNASHVFCNQHVALGHARLSIIDVTYGNQPMSCIYQDNRYTLVYNGELYNTNGIRQELIGMGFEFTTQSDTEVVLKSYLAFGKKCVHYLNGIFAFAIYDEADQSIFFARDRLGIKPLFYTKSDKHFIFASEIKALLSHPDVSAILNKEGICEMLGLGPAHTPGKTYFKNIEELKPGYTAILKRIDDKYIFGTEKYWDLETKECHDTEEQAIEKIHDLVVDSCKRQLVSDVGICSMLSGGLDSSVLTKIAKDNIDSLTTFSIDFVGNDTDFTANIYQQTKDSDYVKVMKDFLQTNHQTIQIDNSYLYDLLDKAMMARDMPGMADIDSSMYAFCEAIHQHGFKVCLSGECSDEIFGGYPWFYREHLVNHDGFPWALSEKLRNDLIKPGILEENELQNYITNALQDTLKNVEHLENSDAYENRYKDINYLTVKWFMNTLVERTDRMSMANSLEVRVPFADHRIFEYVYNLPAKLKLGLTNHDEPVEKYLLRKAFEKELPEDVVYRKKSPFPKTYDPNYLKAVEDKMLEIMANKNLKIHQIINFDYVQHLIDTHGSDLKENLFGQLMTYPQTLAYMIQMAKWLEVYDIKIEL